MTWMAVWAVMDLRKREISVLSLWLALLGGAGWQLAAEKLFQWDTAGGILLGGAFWIFCCLSGEQMGKGDALVILCMGLHMGVRATLVILFFSFLLSSIWACYLLLIKRKTKRYAMPFVPFLAAASWIAALGTL